MSAASRELGRPFVRRDRDAHAELEPRRAARKRVEVGRVVAGVERAAEAALAEQPPDGRSLVRLDRRQELEHLAPEAGDEARPSARAPATSSS